MLKIDLKSFAKYLENNGWHKISKKDRYVKTYQYQNDDHDFYQVSIPLTRELWGYEQTVVQAFRIAAKAENRPAIELVLQFCDTKVFSELLPLVPDQELSQLYQEIVLRHSGESLEEKSLLKRYQEIQKGLYGISDPDGVEKDILMEIADRWNKNH